MEGRKTLRVWQSDLTTTRCYKVKSSAPAVQPSWH